MGDNKTRQNCARVSCCDLPIHHGSDCPCLGWRSFDKAKKPRDVLSHSTDGLAGCPFCGGEAEVATHEESSGKYIRCKRCNCSTALHYGECENLNAAWNERTS